MQIHAELITWLRQLRLKRHRPSTVGPSGLQATKKIKSRGWREGGLGEGRRGGIKGAREGTEGQREATKGGRGGSWPVVAKSTMSAAISPSWRVMVTQIAVTAKTGERNCLKLGGALPWSFSSSKSESSLSSSHPLSPQPPESPGSPPPRPAPARPLPPPYHAPFRAYCVQSFHALPVVSAYRPGVPDRLGHDHDHEDDQHLRRRAWSSVLVLHSWAWLASIT